MAIFLITNASKLVKGEVGCVSWLMISDVPWCRQKSEAGAHVVYADLRFRAHGDGIVIPPPATDHRLFQFCFSQPRIVLTVEQVKTMQKESRTSVKPNTDQAHGVLLANT